jgi:hypothetical protein
MICAYAQEVEIQNIAVITAGTQLHRILPKLGAIADTIPVFNI